MEGLCDRGTECDERPRASGGKCSSKGIDIRADGGSEGQDSNRNIQKLQELKAEAILGKSFLEPRLLRFNDRSG